jgi:hypothetical protein
MACQGTAHSLDNRGRTGAIIIDSLKVFDLLHHDWLLTKTVNSGVNIRVGVWVGEWIPSGPHRECVEEVRVMSGEVQGSVLGPLLFLAYTFDIWRNMESTIRLCADACITHRRKLNNTKQTNSMALSRQAKYTDWATATCQRNLVPTFVDRGVSHGQCGGTPAAVNLSFLDRSRYFSFK